ncbi:ABC transporter ATP-binding protein [Alkalibaculum sporogenes]|nr:ABC transporter ATP-binding protein [Alkalibaculum sporogenes]
MEDVLNIKNLTKRYNEFCLNSISFTLRAGRILGLLGSNGSGKSTIIKSIIGLIQPDSGEIEIFGKSLYSDELWIKNKIGYVGDDFFYPEDLTSASLNILMGSVYDEWESSKFKTYLERYNVPKKKQIATFSKGMKMKLSLSVALSHNPDLIILDEPTEGIDTKDRHEILRDLEELSKNQYKSILITTHHISEMEHIIDDLVIIEQGNMIVTIGKKELLESRPDCTLETIYMDLLK